MTYAGDLFSWYAGSLEADVYFCPERQGTYYGGFYIKDAPAIGIWSRTPLRSPSAKVLVARMPVDAADAARELFARLRAFDEQGVTLIWVESPPAMPEWEAVADRLRRAAAA